MEYSRICIFCAVIFASIYYSVAAPASNFETDRHEFLQLAREFDDILVRLTKDFEEDGLLEEKDKGPVLQDTADVLNENEERGRKGNWNSKGPVLHEPENTDIIAKGEDVENDLEEKGKGHHEYKGPVLHDPEDEDLTLKELLDAILKLKSESQR